MITIKTKKDIEVMKVGGKILKKTLSQVAQIIKPGIDGLTLDNFAYKFITENNCTPAFLNYKANFMSTPFPATLCVSKNNVIVHGVPSKKLILNDGDIVSIDCGLSYKNLYVDSAITVCVGKVDPKTKKLIKSVKDSLNQAIRVAKAGNTIGDIGYAIQKQVETDGFNVIRELVGHGVGYQLHEEPEIYNFGIKNSGIKLKPGYVLAIEPMATFDKTIVTQNDDDEFVTGNDQVSAHFEHTIAITDKEPIVLTK
ncbi:MAG: type I methionyl aminopeptidase [Candidatus Pacebacteria bacterium]|nr:type I methionyl aminopeptidase [Candidatus Paceibacterota bacterium]